MLDPLTLDAIEKKSIKIIMVDDDEISSFIYRKIIELAGLDISHVKTFLKAEEALMYLKDAMGDEAIFPDLILLDINMPEMDGWQFLDEYSTTIWPHLVKKTVICMLSSSVYLKDKNRALSYPQVDDYASKPLTSRELEKLINKHFGD